MKKPQIDIYQTGVQDHINKVGFKKKFLRLWGNDGTVLTEKHEYYPNISPQDVELFKLLGVYKELKQTQGNMSGIESAWVYLNPKKVDAATLSDELLIQELDFQIQDGIYTVNITPNATVQKREWFSTGPITHQLQDGLGLLDYTDMDLLGQYIETNYTQVLDQYVVEGIGDTDIESLVAMHILGGSNSFNHTIKNVSYALVDNIKKVAVRRDSIEEQRYVSYRYSLKSISIEIEINQISTPSQTDPLVQSILTQKAKNAAKIKAEQDSAAVTNQLLESALNKKELVTNDFWLDSRMRTSIFSASVLKTKDLIPLIQGSIDTGYVKKRTKWWKKILVMVVFVVVLYFTGGTAATTLSAFASSFTVATLAVVALSTAMNAWGDDTGAAFAGKFSQKLSVIGTFIGFAAIVNSVATQISTAMTEVTKQAAIEGVKYGVVETVTRAIGQMIVNYAKSTATNLTLEKGISYANQIFGMYSNNKLENLQDRVKSIQQQNAETSQFDEENRSRDIGRSLIKAHGEMFHQDSVDKYDYQYESWSSPMHIGNVQRTGWKWERTGAKIDLRDNPVK